MNGMWRKEITKVGMHPKVKRDGVLFKEFMRNNICKFRLSA